MRHVSSSGDLDWRTLPGLTFVPAQARLDMFPPPTFSRVMATTVNTPFLLDLFNIVLFCLSILFFCRIKLCTRSFQIFMIVTDWVKQEPGTVLPPFLGPAFFVFLPRHVFCLTLLFFLFPFPPFFSVFLRFFPFLFLFVLLLFLLFQSLLLVGGNWPGLLASLDEETFPETSEYSSLTRARDDIARTVREMVNNLITLILKLNCFQIINKMFKCSSIWGLDSNYSLVELMMMMLKSNKGF